MNQENEYSFEKLEIFFFWKSYIYNDLSFFIVKFFCGIFFGFLFLVLEEIKFIMLFNILNQIAIWYRKGVVSVIFVIKYRYFLNYSECNFIK